MLAKQICISLAMVVAALAAGAGEVLDRVAATVNGHPILLSDVSDELRYECLLSGRGPAQCDLSPPQTTMALDRLVDQELLGEQMGPEIKTPRAEEIEKQMASLQADLLRAHPRASWDELLSRYGLSEKSIEQRVTRELRELAFLDARFRPSIQVTPGEIEQYYKEQLAPNLKPGDPEGLAAATGKIREILVQGKINQMLDSWLATLRRQARIHIAQADGARDAANIPANFQTPSQAGTE